MKDIDAYIRAGQLEVKLNCDSSQLDDALQKVDLLIQKAERAQSLGVLPGGIVTAGIVTAGALQAADKQVSRRGLLGLRWVWPR